MVWQIVVRNQNIVAFLGLIELSFEFWSLDYSKFFYTKIMNFYFKSISFQNNGYWSQWLLIIGISFEWRSTSELYQNINQNVGLAKIHTFINSVLKFPLTTTYEGLFVSCYYFIAQFQHDPIISDNVQEIPDCCCVIILDKTSPTWSILFSINVQ